MLTTLRSLPLSRLVAMFAAVVLCACAARLPLGENVAPPHFVVGDHWEYRITDGLRREVAEPAEAKWSTLIKSIGLKAE